MSRRLSGQVQTVLGPIAPEDLGPTSTHEHLFLDFTWVFKPPSEASERARAYEPVTMENLGWVRYDPFRSYDNLLRLDEDEAISEALLFQRAGGGTIVDTTSIGIRRDPLALARVSSATGVNVVMGAGYYVHPAPSRRYGRQDRRGHHPRDRCRRHRWGRRHRR